MKQNPFRDANGVLDSDLLLKWGSALLFLGGCAIAILAGPFDWTPPAMEFLILPLAASLGYAGAFIMKGYAGAGSSPQVPPMVASGGHVDLPQMAPRSWDELSEDEDPDTPVAVMPPDGGM